MVDINEEFDKWFDSDGEGGEWLYDVSGGDWDDLVAAIREAYERGWEDAKERYNETH